MSLKQLIQWAFGIKGFQIAGAPGWLDSDRYDIAAKSDGLASTNQLMQMLQALLASDSCYRFTKRAGKSTPLP